MGAGHEHGNEGLGHRHHGHSREGDRRRLAWTLGLVLVYMLAEVAGGLWANSLALLADAGHMLSDAGALALSLFALWIAARPSTPRKSYGFYRAEILAALVNGATLIAISAFIFFEAVARLRAPAPVLGSAMLLIAAGGLAVNLAGLWLLAGARGDSLNLRGAWLHVLTDALGSAGAIVAGALILAFGWTWADPVASMLIGLLVLYSSWKLLQEAVAVLMEGVPGSIDMEEVRQAIAGMPGVTGVHDLHVWTITSGLVAMSGHVAVQDGHERTPLLEQAHRMLYERFRIAHVTIQIEPLDFQECPVGEACGQRRVEQPLHQH
jgi:cobalt-zinc-cadmium efflux system protein